MQKERFYRILKNYEDGYTVEWTWEGEDDWYWLGETYTLWGARKMIRKAEHGFDDPFVVGTFNSKGERID